MFTSEAHGRVQESVYWFQPLPILSNLIESLLLPIPAFHILNVNQCHVELRSAWQKSDANGSLAISGCQDKSKGELLSQEYLCELNISAIVFPITVN